MRIKSSLVLILVLALAAVALGQGAKTQGRAAFARALKTINSKMSRDEVRALLGEPDDVLTEAECLFFGINQMYPDAYEVWAYGTNGHLTFPTLGMVTFEGRDLRPHGASVNKAWEPIPDGTIEEEQLRSLLRTLDHQVYAGATYEGVSSDPLWVVRIANSLILLGPERAGKLLKEFARLDWPCNDFTVYNAALVAFAFPAGATLPDVTKYSAGPVTPEELQRLDHPTRVFLFEDMPISLDGPVAAVDHNRLLWDLGEAIEKSGIPRDGPLRPSNAIATAATRIKQTAVWREEVKRFPSEDAAQMSLWRQLLLLARSAMKPDLSRFTEQDGHGNTKSHWGNDVSSLEGEPIQWDEATQGYAIAGQQLPVAPPETIWSQSYAVPGMESQKMHVILAHSSNWAYACVRWFNRAERALPMKVRILSVEGSVPLMLEVPFPLTETLESRGRYAAGGIYSMSDDSDCQAYMSAPLSQAKKIVIEVEKPDGITRSQVFTLE